MPGKFPTVGFETEFFTMDEGGRLINRADALMGLLEGKKRVRHHLREEILHSILEFGAYPGRSLKETGRRYLENLRIVIDAGEENGIKLLPISCYPGRSRPRMRKKTWYTTQSLLLGRNKFSRAMRTCGFHFHYSLPKGLVEKETTRLRSLRYSEARKIFLNQYNLLVAADPACITFCQSSPLTEGEHFAKDSRLLLYRDMVLESGKKDVYGLYYEHPMFGGLPHYEYTLADLRGVCAKRKVNFIEMLHAKGIRVHQEVLRKSDLRFMWGAIRINRIGTIEYRGPDMNHPSYLFSTAYLVKLALDAIKSQGLRMLPSDIGLKEPFKREGNRVYLPPFSMVKRLEKKSALKGFDSMSVHKYCSAFFRFVTRTARRRDMARLKPIVRMLERRKTVSDDVLDFVKKKGYSADNAPPEVLRELSLFHSELLSRDTDSTIKLLSH